MVEIIGVQFQKTEKSYPFRPSGHSFEIGDRVICNTAYGQEFGRVTMKNQMVDEKTLSDPVRPILRPATEQDLARFAKNQELEKQAFPVAEACIRDHGLDMKLVAISYTFDRRKMLFYFTADSRIDFRSLVRSLAALFHTRIELRQIGVRDEARMLGGIGSCGRPFCCSCFLGGFHPVSIKMAKVQNLSLNPTKISGACGRLMCCLQYEHLVYDELAAVSPRVGETVNTPEGIGKIVEGDLLAERYKVKLSENPDAPPRSFHRDDLSYRNHPAVVKKAAAKPEVPETEQPAVSSPAKDGEQQKPGKKNPKSRRSRRSGGRRRRLGNRSSKKPTGSSGSQKPKG